MPCGNNQNRNPKRNEIIVNNTLFSYNLEEVGENAYDLVVTPCNLPTSVYCVARITRRNNCCNNMEYFQSFINTDPVEIIQDCNLEQTIIRSINNYFNNVNSISNGCCNRNCGLF